MSQTNQGDTGQSHALRTQLTTLEQRSFKTYQARQSASARLGQRARAWNWALIAFSTTMTIASIGMLNDEQMYGNSGSTLLVCLSVLALVFSLATSSLDYSARSRDMFLNYRKVQRLSVEAERLSASEATPSGEEVDGLYDRYNDLLDESENHTTGDYLRHYPVLSDESNPSSALDRQRKHQRTRALWRDGIITFFPYATIAVPVLIVIPLARAIF